MTVRVQIGGTPGTLPVTRKVFSNYYLTLNLSLSNSYNFSGHICHMKVAGLPFSRKAFLMAPP